ncbi:MAG: histidinol-phosphatase [Anaerolineales bacterium]|nr:histidinol-phosphatase [Anaerolineales bacterium]
MTTPILYDTHMHTPLCKHARGEPEEYAAAAERRGLKGIVFTCHNPGPDRDFSPTVRMAPDEFDDYVALVARARRAWNGRIDVRLGIECDYTPEMAPYLRDLLQRAEFHHVLGSVHPQLPYYRKQFDTGDAAAFYQTYFAHLAQAAETGLFDTLAHPDLVKNVYHREWDVARVLDDVRASLDRIAATGVAMELNTSGLNKTVREMNPNPTMLAEMRARDIPVVVGSDAHEPGRVAADFGRALDLLEAAGYDEVSFFLDRRRHTAAIADVRASLR